MIVAMEFSCCAGRKSESDFNHEKQKIKSRSDALDTIQKFSKSIEIKCSYILCGKLGIRPLERQATIGKNIYYFCTSDCWEDWLKQYDLKNYGRSPSSLDSPEDIKKYSKLITLITPLFI